MKIARLRKTGKQVNRKAVEGLWKILYQLWETDALAFVEFARHSRKRSYVIKDRRILAYLASLGLIDTKGRDFPVHDAVRELVALCVEGDGIQTMLYRPFEDDGIAVSVIQELLSGKPATCHIVDSVLKKLEELLEGDYIAFVELTRFVRDGKAPMDLFGDNLGRLLSGGFLKAHLEESIDGMRAELHSLFERLLGGSVLIDGPKMCVCDEVIADVLKDAGVGTNGMDFNLRSPFKATAKATPHSNGHSTNGSARKTQPQAANN